jgi:peptide/nickel transport system substrate-binding protein
MQTSVRRTFLATLVALGLLTGVVAGGCSSKGTQGPTTSGTLADEGTPVDGGSLVWAVRIESQGWNPHDSKWAQPSALVGSSVLEPLATIGPNLEAEPWLATSFTPNATYDSWTLTLRPGVVFHDGEKFDAASVKANIDDVSTAGLSGAAVRGLFKQVTVLDDLTVRVDLNQPWAAFPTSFLNGQSAMQMAPASLSAPDRGQTHPVGTGPFAFASWTPDNEFRTVKNTNYWRAGEPHLDALTFRVIGDSASAAAALSTGDVNLLFADSAQVANQFASSETVIRNWTTEPGVAITNTAASVAGKTNPLANRHARLALAYATDRQALTTLAGDGVVSGTSPFPSDSPWGLPADQNGYVDFDVEKAKQEVAAYMAETGDSSLSVTLSGTPDTDQVRLMQLIQSQWQDAGIKMAIDTKEASSFITDVVGGKYQVALFNFYSSPDPDQDHYFWSAATAPGAGGVNINFTQYTTPQMEADLKVGRENPDHAARKAAYDDLVHQINGAAVNIWTFSTPYSIIAAPAVKGLKVASEVPFGNFQPKTWLGGLWLKR